MKHYRQRLRPFQRDGEGMRGNELVEGAMLIE